MITRIPWPLEGWTSRLIEKLKFLERLRGLWPSVDPWIAAGYVTVNPFDVTTAVPYTLSCGRLQVASQWCSTVYHGGHAAFCYCVPLKSPSFVFHHFFLGVFLIFLGNGTFWPLFRIDLKRTIMVPESYKINVMLILLTIRVF